MSVYLSGTGISSISISVSRRLGEKAARPEPRVSPVSYYNADV